MHLLPAHRVPPEQYGRQSAGARSGRGSDPASGTAAAAQLHRRRCPLHEVWSELRPPVSRQSLVCFAVVDPEDNNELLDGFRNCFELRRHCLRYGMGHPFTRPTRERMRRWQPSSSPVRYGDFITDMKNRRSEVRLRGWCFRDRVDIWLMLPPMNRV